MYASLIRELIIQYIKT